MYVNFTTRFMIVSGIVAKDGRLIPFWELNGKIDTCGDIDMYATTIDGKEVMSYVPLVYDMVTKTLSKGKIIDVYPPLDTKSIFFDFSTGDKLLRPIEKGRALTIDVFKEIIFEEYEDHCSFGKNAPSFYKGELNPNEVYCFRNWKKTYVMESGFKTTNDLDLRPYAPSKFE